MKVSIFINILSLIILFIGCNSRNCETDSKVIASNDSIIANFDLRLYLKYNKEPILSSYSHDCFRLTIMLSLEDQLFVYKLERMSDSILFSIKYLHRSSGGIIRDEKIILTDQQWNEFNDLIYEKNFWSIPCFPIQAAPILHGTTWLLEGFNIDKNYCTDRNFHFAGRAEGYGEKEFFDICKKLIAFGN